MRISRRSVLAALGIALPIEVAGRAAAAATPPAAPALRLRSFEEALRQAFANATGPGDGPDVHGPVARRVEVGYCEEIRAGVQGCHNDRPFAGFPAGHLRIIRCGSEPGPSRQGVRLYVSTLDIALVGCAPQGIASRPLDFAGLPPAPSFL
jgi:hypothetical protein